MNAITIKLKVSDQVCADIMCAALEGGIGYWAQADDIVQRADYDYVSCKLCEMDDDEGFNWSIESHVFTLDYDAVRRGVERILNGSIKIRKDLLAQVATAGGEGADIDADAADCIVQAALLNELRYG